MAGVRRESGPGRGAAGSARRPSMADVAARAGVSGQTVSRVVNGSPRVDPATRARVVAALQELDYRPHRAARALRTGRTQTVGVVAETLATVGNSRMLQAVVDAASVRGYAVVVVTLGDDGSVEDAFERLRDQGVDGAIVLNEATRLVEAASVPAGLRLVVVDSPPRAADREAGRATVNASSIHTSSIHTSSINTSPINTSPINAVQTGHADGARAAVAHLLGLGHRTVHHLAGPAGSFSSDERERGWREALQAVGAEAHEVVRGDWSAASGFEVGRMLASDASVTAVFCANDQMALGLLRALAVAGRRVPQDVSVVGFDDVADAAQFQPPLSTVHQDFDALGTHALDVLVGAIEGASGGDAGVHFDVVPTRLVVRASTAPPHTATRTQRPAHND